MRDHSKFISIAIILFVIYLVFLLPGCNSAVYPSYYGGGYLRPMNRLFGSNDTSFYFSRDVRSGSVSGSRQLGGGPRGGK